VNNMGYSRYLPNFNPPKRGEKTEQRSASNPIRRRGSVALPSKYCEISSARLYTSEEVFSDALGSASHGAQVAQPRLHFAVSSGLHSFISELYSELTEGFTIA